VTPATQRRLAWASLGVAVVLSLIAAVFFVRSLDQQLPPGTFGFRGFTFLFVVAFGGVGVLIATRLPKHPIGWLFLSCAVLAGAQELAQDYALYAVKRGGSELGEVAAWIPAWIWVPATATGILALFLFPDGHLVSRRWRWAFWFGIAGIVVGSLGLALQPGPLQNFATIDNPFGIGGSEVRSVAGLALIPYAIASFLAAASLVVRYRRSRGEVRQQLKWVLAPAVFMALTLFTSPFFFNATSGWANALSAAMVIVAFFSWPVAIGIGILRYRALDIDVVIKKTVVFTMVAGAVTAFYVIVVLALPTAVLGIGSSIHPDAVMIGVLIGLLLLPIRNRARRFADRIVYGERATPYEVLEEFSGRMSEVYATEDVLPRMARILGEAVGAERAHVWLRLGGELRPAGTWPADATMPPPVRLVDCEAPPMTGDLAVPVRHQGEHLGTLEVEMPDNDPMNPERERLVHGLAAQAGLVLRNARLIEELRASRQRLVAAQDHERRKIERNIHDGAQQQLVALAVKLRLAEQVAERDGVKTKELLTQLQADTHAALEDLRDLARGIYPPLLADKGLGPALEAQARKTGLPVTVSAEAIGRYPQEVEAAVYFSCLEAMQNVTKYAQASHVRIELTHGAGNLAFRVTDDGHGFDPSRTSYGTGLQGMADRLAALGGELEVRSEPGGGTTVAGRLPVEGTVQ
jgi:signal transduction histidine kinase